MKLLVCIGNREILVREIASDHVAEMLLGIDWHETQGAVWNLRRGEIYMHGGVYPLKARTHGDWCRRIIVEKPVVSVMSWVARYTGT